MDQLYHCKKVNQLEHMLLVNEIRILFCSELGEELDATIKKPKFKKYFSANALDEMLDVFEPFIDFIKVKNKVKICRDPKDNFLPALSQRWESRLLINW